MMKNVPINKIHCLSMYMYNSPALSCVCSYNITGPPAPFGTAAGGQPQQQYPGPQQQGYPSAPPYPSAPGGMGGAPYPTSHQGMGGASYPMATQGGGGAPYPQNY